MNKPVDKSKPAKAGAGDVAKPASQQESSGKEILGLSTDELAGLSVRDLEGNRTAIKMLLHYYKNLVEENAALRNDLNTARTYVDGYSRKKTYTNVATVMLVVANIFIGFGVNLLTSGQTAVGLSVFLPGVALTAGGIYFSVKN